MEIRRINVFERRWKIKTNMTKFNVVALDRKLPSLKFSLGGGRYEKASKKGRFLGYHLHKEGIRHAAINRATAASKILAKLRPITGLSQPRKRQVYNAKVRTRLMYPTVPWSAMTNRHIHHLQKVQNRGVDFIGGYPRWMRIRARIKAEEARIPPLNQALQEASGKVWTKLRRLHPELIQNLEGTASNQQVEYKVGWPSALRTNMDMRPPVYTMVEAQRADALIQAFGDAVPQEEIDPGGSVVSDDESEDPLEEIPRHF